MTVLVASSPIEDSIPPGEGYAGEVTSKRAWEILVENPKAVLVDTRTQAEWVFIGVPDLRSIDRRAVFVPWKLFPRMQPNPEFAQQIEAAGVKQDDTVLFICRSGNRSKDAAIAMTVKGYKRCFNVSDGFEGNLDDDRHRGTQGGWKVAGLPWIQD
ncbi:MAG: rhodanese-like domain-containing protein [Proteobacteria bacterium]|nr:rhodanese-like domain-containing protein [Pseudomonadota bacterium]MCH8092649.1 rhodanese-like domain-containing protein [Pseudomonadota bacterium]MCH8095723.1 rhodanese-like domain-containing protein [Pseudomonadota bacterium]